jgi:hypothetical protein
LGAFLGQFKVLGLVRLLSGAIMRRREFINGMAALGAAWPLKINAQQPQQMRRVAIILATTAEDVEFQTWVGF